MEKKIRNKAIKSIKWTTLNTIFLAISAPIYKILLAKLLTPNEFGYMAVVSIFIGITNLINNLGLGEAIIQKDNVTSEEISTLFLFDIIKSLLSGLLLYVLSGTIADYSGMEKLELILKITAGATIVLGVSSTFRVYLQKNMYFKELSIIQGIKVVVDMVTSIIFILYGYGIIGFILGTLICNFIYSILIFIVFIKKTSIKLKVYFSFRALKPFIEFGFFISIKQIFTFITQQLDILLIGTVFSQDILGVYYFAKDLLQKPQQLITQSFTQVLYPMFSEMKYDNNLLSKIYNKVSKYMSAVAFPIFTGIAITSHIFVPILFGEQWVMSVGIIKVFAVVSIFQVLSANISTSMLYSLNKPKLVLSIDIVYNTLYFCGLILFSKYGLISILIIYSMYVILKTITLQYYVNKNLNKSFYMYIYQLRGIVYATIIMIIVVNVYQNIFREVNLVISFIISIFIGIVSYSIGIGIFDNEIMKKILGNKYLKMFGKRK